VFTDHLYTHCLEEELLAASEESWADLGETRSSKSRVSMRRGNAQHRMKNNGRLGVMAHACNPSYPSGRDQENGGLKSDWAKS
jgi:hypothetical protein